MQKPATRKTPHFTSIASSDDGKNTEFMGSADLKPATQ
jgi:hypothetical protein